MYTDRATGRTVRQLTDHPSINHPTYFLQSSFTPDGKALVFTSYRSGSAQLFEASFPDGEIRQLTEGPAIHPFSPAIHPGLRALLNAPYGQNFSFEFSRGCGTLRAEL